MDTTKVAHNNFVKWFHNDFTPSLEKEFKSVRLESRKNFVSLWEHFYVPLASRGVINSDAERYLSDGERMIKADYPDCRNWFNIPENINQLEHYQKANFLFSTKPSQRSSQGVSED